MLKGKIQRDTYSQRQLKVGEIIKKSRSDFLDRDTIHDYIKDPKNIFEFCKLIRKRNYTGTIIAVPTTYNHVKEKQLIDHGINIVIYANHLLRASYPAMQKAAEKILKFSRSQEVDKDICSIKTIL